MGEKERGEKNRGVVLEPRYGEQQLVNIMDATMLFDAILAARNAR